MEATESNLNIVEEEDINLGTNTKQKGISLKNLGNNKNIDPGYHQVVQFSSTTWKNWYVAVQHHFRNSQNNENTQAIYVQNLLFFQRIKFWWKIRLFLSAVSSQHTIVL